MNAAPRRSEDPHDDSAMAMIVLAYALDPCVLDAERASAAEPEVPR